MKPLKSLRTTDSDNPGWLRRFVRPRTQHCEMCQHHFWSEEYANTPKHLQCWKGYRPRFYLPQSPIDQDWGWKRKCHDYELGDHVQKITATQFGDLKSLNQNRGSVA